MEELTYEMSRYRGDILGLCDVRWKNFRKTSTQGGHNKYISGKEDKHEKDYDDHLQEILD